MAGDGPTETAAVMAAVLLLGTLAALAWSWHLRNRMKSQTRQLRESLTRTREAESAALRLSKYDGETGLPKLQHFVQLVEESLRHSREHASSEGREEGKKELLVIKLLQLNELVKFLGREYSEQVIKDFAKTLNALAEGPCAYFGRGVFAVFSDHDNVRELFRSLLAQWKSESQNFYSHIIGGSALYPDHGSNGADLVQHAETALAVSRSGRRRWMTYHPEMEPDALDLKIVSSFRAKPFEGLYAVYQPQVDLKTGQISGAEALVRWNHPGLGPISPGKFIPLIEKAGLVSQVTAMMINEAVRVSTCLRDTGTASIISVNISVSDLMETDLQQIIERALEVYNGAPEDLKLELTETSVATDSNQIRDVLHRLDDLGVSISVDDFGTGYSSFSYLSVFPIHEVKIDRDFIGDMVENPRNRSIVRSTILMARELGLQTVAEGAENMDTIRLLLEHGCDRVQGFVFARPLPEDEFLAFSRRHADQSLYRTLGLERGSAVNQYKSR